MKLAICSSDKFNAILGNELIKALQQPGAVCLASGDTPQAAYQYVAEYYHRHPFPIRATLIGLDEWAGLGPDDVGSCQYYMHLDLFDKLPLKPGQLIEFNARQTPQALASECEKMNRLLDSLTLNLVILGVGQNGHLGLNEPGTDFTTGAHVTTLSPSTINVAQKYFAQQTSLTHGITLGIANILKSEKIILTIRGKHKNEIAQRIIFDQPDIMLPASSLKLHNNTVLLIDDEVLHRESLYD